MNLLLPMNLLPSMLLEDFNNFGQFNNEFSMITVGFFAILAEWFV